MTDPKMPTGAKLDVLVIWSVAYYNNLGGFVGSNDLIHIIGAKVGYDDQRQVGDQEARNVLRSIDRVSESKLITFDTAAGYRIANL